MLKTARHICDTYGKRFAWDDECKSHACGPIEGACVVFCCDSCANKAANVPGGIEAFFHERIEFRKVDGGRFAVRRIDEFGLEVRPKI